MPVMRRLRTYIFLFCCSLLCAYGVLEIGVRVFRLPQKSLVHDMEKEIDRSDGELASHFPMNLPVYGWDLPALVIPRQSAGEKRHTILFIGDSVTRGHSVDPHQESYPVLLYQQLRETNGLRLVNAAVPAFGIDQMMLKLERMVVEYDPAIVVFAYIPHDLWRSGRNINNGLTKPVLLGLEDNSWQTLPMPDIKSYYQRFLLAKKYFHMGPWVLQHMADNARYYFPGVYSDYYLKLFHAIRERLVGLGEVHDMQVVVVRLASIWPGDAVPALDKLAISVFAPPAANYYFVDTESCVKATAKTAGIDYESEFSWHPGPEGHAIYASCLQRTLLPLIL
jgi:hypothetical protein